MILFMMMGGRSTCCHQNPADGLAGFEAAATLTAVTYTAVWNCTMHGINPEEYLKDVLGRLPRIKADETRELTPEKWLAARTPASRIA